MPPEHRELSVRNIVRDVAERASQRVVQRTIRTLRAMPASGLAGDDSNLRTVWDEICVQRQVEESFYWDAYDETVRSVVRPLILELPAYKLEALWLQTPDGDDWLDQSEQAASRSTDTLRFELDFHMSHQPDVDTYPVDSQAVVDYVVEELAYSAAFVWTNARITRTIERGYLD